MFVFFGVVISTKSVGVNDLTAAPPPKSRVQNSSDAAVFQRPYAVQSLARNLLPAGDYGVADGASSAGTSLLKAADFQAECRRAGGWAAAMPGALGGAASRVSSSS